MQANYANALCHRNATPLIKRKWGSVWAGDFSLSLSLSLSLLALFGTLKFLNTLFLGFCALFVILSVAKNPKNLRYALFMDTSLTLSMTNSGFCLKITDIFTQILGTKFTNFIRFYGLPRSLCSLAMTARQKFKFFIQNSRHSINLIHFVNSKHFINSTHFINLTQISSPTQGFFIFLPQVFAQCKLIKNFLQGGHCV